MAMIKKNPPFVPGTQIRTIDGETLQVIECFYSGNKFTGYSVTYKDRRMILQWYDESYFSEEEKNKLYEELKAKISAGKPSDIFLWPETATEMFLGSFGCVMSFLNENCHGIEERSTEKDVGGSFRNAVEICMKIATGFEAMHKLGLCFANCSREYVRVNYSSCDVAINDFDEVVFQGTTSDSAKELKYVAPEVKSGKALPGINSDRYFLAELFYHILLGGHPLEGRKWAEEPILSPALLDEIYSTKPLFVFDEEDASNRPAASLSKLAIKRWEILPGHVKELFLRTFGKAAYENPKRRATEEEWLVSLARLYSEVTLCDCCRDEVIIRDNKDCVCATCDKSIIADYFIKLDDYSVPVTEGGKIFGCQIGETSTEKSNEPVALFLKKEEGVYGIKNIGDEEWVGITPSGKINSVAPDAIVPVKAGINLRIGGTELVIEANDGTN